MEVQKAIRSEELAGEKGLKRREDSESQKGDDQEKP
jgi:hypothetical protein